MGRKHNEFICKLNVSLDSVLVHTLEDFTIFFSNQLIMPLANYAVKRLINSLRLMLDTSAFHFLFCGNLTFIAELWFIMQPLCFTRQSFFVKSFFHSRQGRKFSILWSLVVIVTRKRVKELKRVRGV